MRPASAKRQALLRDADDHAADDVDEHHQQAGDGVAAHELRGAVHGAEEAALVLEILAALARRLLVDQAGAEIGVDRHLLARHGVEVEARRDFGDAAGALGDDDEVHDHQDGEDDDADDEVAAHHEVAERLDDVAGGGGAFVAVRQDQARRGEVERQPQHGRDQQHGREGGEFQRRVDEQRRHQDQHRQDDRDRQRQVEQDRRQRQDQDDEDGQNADRERDVAALEHGAEGAERRKLEAARGGGGRGSGAGSGHVAHGSANSWAVFAGYMVTGGLMDTAGDWIWRCRGHPSPKTGRDDALKKTPSRARQRCASRNKVKSSGL